MVSPSGRYVLTFNGEVYDHLRLRESLNRVWHGHSDTETVAALCDELGVPAAVKHLSGMMALAVWDREEQVLWLARDRFGKKPLAWSRLPDGIAFASELTALRCVPGLQTNLDRSALSSMLKQMAVPDDRSILQDTHKVPAGTILRFDGPETPPVSTRLWDLQAEARKARSSGAGQPTDLAALEQEVSRAVESRLLSDVPLGAFLSGGIDSSLVVAMMREVREDVRTFTIGFEESDLDEAPHARAIAEHLGTDHTERYVRPEDALHAIDDLARVYDEPFADSSQLPTLLLCREARQHVTVALSGDGGDELFAGYDRHAVARKLQWAGRTLPGPLGRGAAALIRAVPPSLWGNHKVGHQAGRVAQFLSGRGDLYARILAVWPDAAKAVHGGTISGGPSLPDLPRSLLAKIMLADTEHYLRDDILVKVDRAAMSVGLEVRCPLLDPGVFEAAWRLPDHAKMKGGAGKLPLRALLRPRVPEALLSRPKQGFAMPVSQWLRGPLESWAADLLDADRLRRQGILRPEPVRALWDAHVQGRRDHHAALWNLLMFQAWYDRWGDSL